MIPILAIARATFTELRRQKLIIVPIIGVVLSLLVLGAILLLNDGSLDLQENDAELAALTTGIGAAIGATVYAAIVGAGLIAREISSGTMLMLAARPIGRWQIIAGRVLGASVFLLGVLFGVCLSYALVAMLTSGSTAPFDEPFYAFAYGGPAMLLALCFGIACSVHGKATAATGTAIGIMLFAWGVGFYADEWRRENHERSFLTNEVRDRIESNDVIVGPLALAAVRALPFYVFSIAAVHQVEDHEDYRYGAEWQRERDRRIDTTKQGGYAMGLAYPATPTPVDPTAPIDPATGMPEDYEPPKLPDEPTEEAFDCAEYGGASCFLGFKDAWKVKSFEQARSMDEGVGLLAAWLAIPFWMGVAMLLLHRRRDLT